jgi:hypothetical protein
VLRLGAATTLDRRADRPGRLAHREGPGRWRLHQGLGSGRQRDVPTPAMWRSAWAGCATTVRGRRGAWRPESRARMGNELAGEDGVRPSAAQACSKCSQHVADTAVTCKNGGGRDRV